ncbi:glycosyl hydrolase [Bacteroidia bacterium]|nr:glycosyl hydrolase [Bacteroidia bacterium]
MKKISILIPTYNEEGNIPVAYNRITQVFKQQLPGYDYEILFIDNDSSDSSRQLIIQLAEDDKKVKAIFNAQNFGWMRSSVYGLINATGDAVVFLAADMQEPPELIPQFVSEWEQGYKIVIAIKNKSKESRLKYFLRSVYYKVIKHIADIDHIDHFTGFGLYDRKFIDVLKNLNDSMPYLRGIVSELGFKHKKVYFEQNERKIGKTKFNFFSLYDLALLGITSYSKVGMRCATIIGFVASVLSLIIALYSLISKLLYWDSFALGMAATTIGVFLLGSLQLFFIGLLGEYILNINTRVMNRPLVIEEQRINFE